MIGFAWAQGEQVELVKTSNNGFFATAPSTTSTFLVSMSLVGFSSPVRLVVTLSCITSGNRCPGIKRKSDYFQKKSNLLPFEPMYKPELRTEGLQKSH